MTNFIFCGLSAAFTDPVVKGLEGKHHSTFAHGMTVKQIKEKWGDDVEFVERPRKFRYVYFNANKKRKKELIKKLKYHGLVITIVAIIVAISNCGKKELLEPSLETVLENYHENTLLDEIINLSNKQSETEATIENINKLEQRLKKIEQRLSLLETNTTNHNYQEPDTSLYMI